MFRCGGSSEESRTHWGGGWAGEKQEDEGETQHWIHEAGWEDQRGLEACGGEEG